MTTLLQTFCPTLAVRARRIIELPQQLGSDTTPTNAWHEISTLQQLPDVDATTGTHKQLDLAKEILLMCLAPQVRRSLHETENRSIQELLTEAHSSLCCYKVAPSFIGRHRGRCHTPSEATSYAPINCANLSCPVASQIIQCTSQADKLLYVGIIAAMEMQHATVLKDANTSKKTLQPAVPRQNSRRASKHLQPTHQR